jgi:hypothetical protein
MNGRHLEELCFEARASMHNLTWALDGSDCGQNPTTVVGRLNVNFSEPPMILGGAILPRHELLLQ